MGTITDADKAEFDFFTKATGLSKAGDSIHVCIPKETKDGLVAQQKADNTPDHIKKDGFDVKVYCDQASLLTWKNTALLASAAVLMQSALI